MATQPQAIPRIIPEALMALLDEEQIVSIVDVRQPEDYFSSSLTILGAIPIAPSDVPLRFQEIPRDNLVVTFCDGAHEETSEQAARFLLSRGFPRVAVLQGGFSAWEALEYPTIPRPDLLTW